MPRYVDIHVIQPVPFSNLNRDQNGMPKSVRFGGSRRTRVSSQSWKRALREHLESTGAAERSVRTRYGADHLADLLVAEHGFDRDEATAAGQNVFRPKNKGYAAPKSDGEGDGAVIYFLAESQFGGLAEVVVRNRDAFRAQDPSKADPGRGTEGYSGFAAVRAEIDAEIGRKAGLVPLLGRMLTSVADGGDVEAALQVAHAFTVHAQTPETDFVTALDDVSKDMAGVASTAGMFPSEFSAGTFYRYATVNVDTLTRNGFTADDVRHLVPAVVEAFVTSMPSGKQTASAAHTRPVFVGVTVSERPENYASAFERPIRSDEGHAEKAVAALDEFASRTAQFYGTANEFAGHANLTGHDVTGFGDNQPLSALYDALRGVL